MNNQAWTSAGKDALWLSIVPLAQYALTNYCDLPTFVSFLVWSLKIFLVSNFLIRMTRRFGSKQSVFGYGQAFGYSFKICLLSSVICTAYFTLDVFVLRPEFLTETIRLTMASVEAQGLNMRSLNYESMMKTLPTTLSLFYFFYLTCCGLLFSALTGLVAKRSDNPFENQVSQEQE